jgi:hypothetical protein
MNASQHGFAVEEVSLDLTRAWSGHVIYRDQNFTYPYPMLSAISRLISSRDPIFCRQTTVSGGREKHLFEIWTPPFLVGIASHYMMVKEFMRSSVFTEFVKEVKEIA